MFKLIFEIVAANMISKSLTAPTRQQVEAEYERQWQIEKKRLLHDKANAMVSDLIRGKNYTDDEILAVHKMANEEVNKALLVVEQATSYVPPPSDNASNVLGRFVGGFVIAIIVVMLFTLGGCMPAAKKTNNTQLSNAEIQEKLVELGQRRLKETP